MNRFLVSIALVASTHLVAAQPADKPLGKTEFAKGKSLYGTGDYLGAATHFAAAFKADPDPAYIFNVGQAYRRHAEAKSGNVSVDCQQSLFAYRKFLEQLPEAPNRGEVEVYIKEMTSCAGRLASEPSPWEPRPPVDKPPVDNPPVEKPPLDKPPIEHASGGMTTMRKIGIGVGAGGVIMGGVGLYFLKKTFDLNHDTDVLQHDGTSDDKQTAELRKLNERGASANFRGRVTGVIGGAMILGGAALFVFGGSSSKETKVTVAPSPQGAMVFGAFRF